LTRAYAISSGLRIVPLLLSSSARDPTGFATFCRWFRRLLQALDEVKPGEVREISA
jgi:hypothetical protein